MWDNARLLNQIANALFALSAVVVLYALLFTVIHLPIFPLHVVKVNGHLNHINREQIQLIVAKNLQGNFFTLDLIKMRDAFEKTPWARHVSLRRRWPDKLEVSIEEHVALARWDNFALVNTHGELFHAASGSDLPIFDGPGDGVKEVTSHYGAFNQALKMVQLEIASLRLTPRRAWQITTTHGMVIELGREEMQSRLERFVKVYRTTLAGLNKEITYVDLRYPNGFAVRKPS